MDDGSSYIVGGTSTVSKYETNTVSKYGMRSAQFPNMVLHHFPNIDSYVWYPTAESQFILMINN